MKKSLIHGYKISHLNATVPEAVKIVHEKNISKINFMSDSALITSNAQIINNSTGSTFANVNLNYTADEKPQHNTKKKNEVFIFYQFLRFKIYNLTCYKIKIIKSLFLNF